MPFGIWQDMWQSSFWKVSEAHKHQELKIKHQFFVKILHQMQAADQPGDVDTLSDYTRLWSELIDQGGLYHINDEVSRVQCYLCTWDAHVCVCVCARTLSCSFFSLGVSLAWSYPKCAGRQHRSEETDFRCSDRFLCHTKVLEGYSWKYIPTKFEQYSVCLLQAILDLWINVRGHSFAQGWTMMFETKYKRGTRNHYNHKEKSRILYCIASRLHAQTPTHPHTHTHCHVRLNEILLFKFELK